MNLRNSVRIVVLGILLIACSDRFAAAVDDNQPKDDADANAFFKNEVIPVLKRRCYECHSHEGDKANGGLVLDSRSGWVVGGDSGPALVPRHPDRSLIIEAVHYGNLDLQMPPEGKIPEGEIALLEKWIAQGAPDPRQIVPAVSTSVISIEEGRKHWAFRPVKDANVPAVKDPDWPLNEIDTFLLARLEQESLRPAPDTDRYTWLRRVSLDLTGLPPTPEEISAFVADDSNEAFARVVDRLLGSRAYGERWARHWLDLTGYADQIGTANNVAAEYAWRYRDYLIDAFATDKPFDGFIREQIAGDLLSGSVEQRAAAITATGFLLLGNIEIAESDKAQMRVDLADQQVSKVGTAFLGLTIGCARCHDHKFDPIPQTDYYALAGIFQSTDSTYKLDRGVWSDIRSAELPQTEAQQTEHAAKIQQHAEQLAAWKQERDAARQEADALEKETDERKKREARMRHLNSLITHAEFFVPSTPRAYAVGDVEKPGDMRITIRGNPHAPGEVVPRGFLQVASWESEVKIPSDQSGRRELADWIASPTNPLTARVAVNRIWQKLFGNGLVRSVDYFGLRGDTPSHPELLDHLAHRFVLGGWSQKKLIRELVLSRAYRIGGEFDEQAYAADPNNRLHWRMAPQRLDAESIRDSMLAVAGTLQPSAGGPALALQYPENVSGLDPKNVNPPAFSLSKYHPGQKLQRTIYLPIIRSGAQPEPAELRNLFDFTQPAEIAGKRAVTAVPTQALFLINGDELKLRAAELAARTIAANDNPSGRIEQLWMLTMGRPISADEKSDSLRFLESQPADESAWVELCRALLASNEFLMRL